MPTANHDSVLPATWTPTAALILDLTKWVAGRGSTPAQDVLAHLFQFSPSRPELGEVNVAVNELVSAGLLSVGPGGLGLTADGRALLQRVQRVKDDSRRLTRLLEELATVERGETTTSWQFGEDEWSCLVQGHIAEKRSGLGARKDIVDGLMIAIERIDEINVVVQSASDRPAAVALLTQAPFSFSEMQAHHVLDMPVSRQTGEARLGLVHESARLAAETDALDDA